MFERNPKPIDAQAIRSRWTLQPEAARSSPPKPSNRTSGRLLHKGPGGGSETGIWVCTPGFWNCHITGDEYCHFLLGRATYTHETGEVIEIRPDTVAYFPHDWRGTCRVHETVRKVYMIR